MTWCAQCATDGASQPLWWRLPAECLSSFEYNQCLMPFFFSRPKVCTYLCTRKPVTSVVLFCNKYQKRGILCLANTIYKKSCRRVPYVSTRIYRWSVKKCTLKKQNLFPNKALRSFKNNAGCTKCASSQVRCRSATSSTTNRRQSYFRIKVGHRELD